MEKKMQSLVYGKELDMWKVLYADSVRLSVCLFVCFCLSVFLSVCLCFCVSVCLSVCLSIHIFFKLELRYNSKWLILVL